MRTSLVSTVLSVVVGGMAMPAVASDTVARFDGGIGSQVAALSGSTFIINDVFGVPPGGRPWVIARLRGDVQASGQISVRGEGLVLAGGNAVGTRGGVTQVAATLFCNGVPSSSGPADLDANGDFDIRGSLAAGAQNPCLNPVLLIRNAPGGVPGAWFAAGIPKR
jgi:hypothetical protein